MKEDTRKIKVESGEVFLVGIQKLNLRRVKTMRTTLENRIQHYRRKQRRLEAEIVETAELIGELEKELEGYNIPELAEWIKVKEDEEELQKAIIKEQKKLAKKKAKQLLREYIGEEEYLKFKKRGFIEFEDRLGRAYQIDSKGNLSRGNSSLCLIRPKNLPTPDFIIATIATIKQFGYSR